MSVRLSTSFALGGALVLFGTLSPLRAVPFETTLSGQYLIIGTQVGGKATDANTSNFELGALKAPVPSTDKFLNQKPSEGNPVDQFSGQTGGPTLISSQPLIPSTAKPVGQGIGYGGNIAVVDPNADFALSNVGVYGDQAVGIRLAGDQTHNKAQNSFFNDPNKFPNTFDPVTQSGIRVEANGSPGEDKIVANQLTRIDAPNSAGVTYNFNHQPLVLELAAAKTAINGLAGTGTLNVALGAEGTFDLSDTYTGPGTLSIQTNEKAGVNATLTLGSGLHVIDIVTGLSGQQDFLLNNSNFVIDGRDDTTVIFRLPDNNTDWGANFLVTNSNILMGNGIGDHSILFYTDQQQNDTNFPFNNMIVNGVAFWALGSGIIDVNNGEGCTQFIADQVDLQDVRFNRCEFGPENHVPESLPGFISAIVLSGLLGIHAYRSRRQVA